MPEKPNMCYIFEILMTSSFPSKYDDRYLTLVILFTPVTLVTLVTLFQSYIQFYRAECITVSGFLEDDRTTNIFIYIKGIVSI